MPGSVSSNRPFAKICLILATGCKYRVSRANADLSVSETNPDVLVMQSTQDWHRHNTADLSMGRVTGESLFDDRCVRA
jgi:hypothetical protein